MRSIEIEDGLRVRFPGRGEEFDEGFEIGMLAVLMTAIGGEFERRVGSAGLDQIRSLADKFGYHLEIGDEADGHVGVLFRTGRSRPKLTLIHSRPGEAARALLPNVEEKPARRSAPTLVRLLDGAALS